TVPDSMRRGRQSHSLVEAQQGTFVVARTHGLEAERHPVLLTRTDGRRVRTPTHRPLEILVQFQREFPLQTALGHVHSRRLWQHNRDDGRHPAHGPYTATAPPRYCMVWCWINWLNAVSLRRPKARSRTSNGMTALAIERWPPALPYGPKAVRTSSPALRVWAARRTDTIRLPPKIPDTTDHSIPSTWRQNSANWGSTSSRPTRPRWVKNVVPMIVRHRTPYPKPSTSPNATFG